MDEKGNGYVSEALYLESNGDSFKVGSDLRGQQKHDAKYLVLNYPEVPTDKPGHTAYSTCKPAWDNRACVESYPHIPSSR